MPVTLAGAVDTAEATCDADASGCADEAEAAPVAPTGETAAVTGAMLDAATAAWAVEPAVVPLSGEAAVAEAVEAAANG